MKSLARQLLGKQGEDFAATYLAKHGFHIIDRNFKARYGELDIIAVEQSTLVFIEVKTRMGRQFGLPEEAVTPRKLSEIIKTGEYYQLLHPKLPQRLRIDVIAIEFNPDDSLKRFNHIRNVTG